MSSCRVTGEVQISQSDQLGSILIADDEETFLYATAELLREQGYQCDCARDAVEAMGMLRPGAYDLLITDIKMPGNPKLELINHVRQAENTLPVIVVTGYPSLDSAIESVHSPVVAYLVKPIDLEQLGSAVAHWAEQSQACRTICDVQQGLEAWSQELARITRLVEEPAKRLCPQLVEAFVATMLKGVLESFAGLQRLTAVLAKHRKRSEQQWMCELARTETMVRHLRDAVEVLERTKNAFKSKQLGQLRHRLQIVLDQWEENKD